jgi:hypothetical protein
VTRRDDGSVDVRLESQGHEFFSRRFDPRETVELLVYLHGGDDTAVVTGRAPSSILVRVIGGNGNNDLVDSSTVGGRAHPTRLYDIGKVKGISYGKDTSFDRGRGSMSTTRSFRIASTPGARSLRSPDSTSIESWD